MVRHQALKLNLKDQPMEQQIKEEAMVPIVEWVNQDMGKQAQPQDMELPANQVLVDLDLAQDQDQVLMAHLDKCLDLAHMEPQDNQAQADTQDNMEQAAPMANKELETQVHMANQVNTEQEVEHTELQDQVLIDQQQQDKLIKAGNQDPASNNPDSQDNNQDNLEADTHQAMDHLLIDTEETSNDL